MNKLNLFSKLAIAGAAATIPTVGSMLIAPSANAQLADACISAGLSGSVNLPICDVIGTGDKVVTFSDIVLGGNNEFEAEIVQSGRTYDVVFDFFHFSELDNEFIIGSDPVDGLSDSIAYTIDITPQAVSDGYMFETVALAQDGVPVFDDFTTLKIVDGEDLLSVTGVGTDGPVDVNGISLEIVDEFSVASGQELIAVTNEFTQISDIPEPGTILGLLAVGGLGLGLKRKKQS